MSPLVEWEGVSRTYGGAVPVEALRSASFAIGVGEHVAVVGPSGSGKSTLLNLLGLLDAPTAGVYRLCGVDVAGLGEADRASLRASMFGFIFQSFHLVATRTAVENVEVGMLYGSRGRKERRQRAVEALDRVGLAHRLHATPSTLSGGERQRVAIARAVAAGPRVLLCDEPTGNLDTATTDVVLQLLAELCRDGITLVVITHEQRVAERAGRVVRVVDGVVSEQMAVSG